MGRERERERGWRELRVHACEVCVGWGRGSDGKGWVEGSHVACRIIVFTCSAAC